MYSTADTVLVHKMFLNLRSLIHLADVGTGAFCLLYVSRLHLHLNPLFAMLCKTKNTFLFETQHIESLLYHINSAVNVQEAISMSLHIIPCHNNVI